MKKIIEDNNLYHESKLESLVKDYEKMDRQKIDKIAELNLKLKDSILKNDDNRRELDHLKQLAQMTETKLDQDLENKNLDIKDLRCQLKKCKDELDEEESK